MPKSKTPIIRLIPSAGKRLKDVSATVDVLWTILAGLLPFLINKHPDLKKTMLYDLKRMRDSAEWSPEQNAAFDKVIHIWEGLVSIYDGQ